MNQSFLGMLQSWWYLYISTNFRYPSLRVAYIDEREEPLDGKSKKVYYSVLVKGGDKLDEVCY